MLLLSSEYSPPPWPPYALLSASRSGPGLRPLRRRLDRLGRFSRLSASVQLSAQVVALSFCLFASPALFGHPLVQRSLRHLSAPSSSWASVLSGSSSTILVASLGYHLTTPRPITTAAPKSSIAPAAR